MVRAATVYTLGRGFRAVADDPVVTQAVYCGIRRVPLFHDGVDANFKNPCRSGSCSISDGIQPEPFS